MVLKLIIYNSFTLKFAIVKVQHHEYTPKNFPTLLYIYTIYSLHFIFKQKTLFRIHNSIKHAGSQKSKRTHSMFCNIEVTQNFGYEVLETFWAIW